MCMVLEKEMEFYIFIQRQQKETVSLAARRRAPPTVTHFLQKGHTYSNKAISPNSATPQAKHVQTTTGSRNQAQGLLPLNFIHSLGGTICPVCYLLCNKTPRQLWSTQT